MPKKLGIDFIERQGWLNPVEKGLQKFVHKSFGAGGDAGRKVADVLHGIWLGDPLHAALTDVPIGSWTAAVVMDAGETISGNEKLAAGADAAIGIGLVGAVAAAITGLTDWQHVGGSPRRVGLVHGLLNLSSAGLFATSLLLRKRKSRGAAKAAAAIGYGVMLTAARLGGELAYGYKIGTDHSRDEHGPEEFTPVLSEAELQDDRPRRVDVDGVPIVLVKSGENVFALGEKCAHLGGPLSEGECRNGIIQCPWHGSQFSLSDGRVVHGPSVHPQPFFDVRVRYGQVEIRRHVESPRVGRDRTRKIA